jgi:hypothetical protein
MRRGRYNAAARKLRAGRLARPDAGSKAPRQK